MTGEFLPTQICTADTLVIAFQMQAFVPLSVWLHNTTKLDSIFPIDMLYMRKQTLWYLRSNREPALQPEKAHKSKFIILSGKKSKQNSTTTIKNLTQKLILE